ncbi:MAG: tRNA (adenosine(37)-N6)-threonylcarbamoyltransferase complex ATPase subunit type 1 TsaE [Candidatus Gottesmanbacteria bacterium]|nr:tRNA (adenosine(37)-N6)-threonylcarbamoyltransferase complex ATPase subunit type 1 TsaE [Candidatus Gottesmanbacteria bacterium]
MDFHKKIITKKPEETARVGEDLARYLGDRGGPHIVCLYGQLGSGKTTFTQGFARGLRIPTRLLSPTFIIVRRYQIPKKDFHLYHVDLYRLQTVSELEGLGLPEIFADLASYTVVEWAERLGGLMPQERIDILFTTEQDDSHTITIKNNS